MMKFKQDKWIKYENNQFIGRPQNLKGSSGTWLKVVYLNQPIYGRRKENMVKDSEYDVCYVTYS